MPRKSIGAASSASAPGTPLTKSGSRKSLSGAAEGTPLADDAAPTTISGSGLVIPPETKAVLRQQEIALKSAGTGIDQLELPRTQVIKVAKSELPDSVQLRKETQQAIIKSATVFISYLTATAHDNASKKGGKTINANHVLEAVKELDLGDDAQKELKEHLMEYRKGVEAKKKASKAEKARGEEGGDGGDADVSRLDGDDDGDVSRAQGEGEEGGDESLLRKSLSKGSNGVGHDDEEDDEEEEIDEGEDQLMDED